MFFQKNFFPKESFCLAPKTRRGESRLNIAGTAIKPCVRAFFARGSVPCGVNDVGFVHDFFIDFPNVAIIINNVPFDHCFLEVLP